MCETIEIELLEVHTQQQPLEDVHLMRMILSQKVSGGKEVVESFAVTKLTPG
jgi:hypothetical protein